MHRLVEFGAVLGNAAPESCGADSSDSMDSSCDGSVPFSKRIRSGSAANEIIKAAKQYDAGLVVVAAGGRGLSDSVLVGSTAQRVQHYAPCPVLVVRPAPKPKKRRS